MASLRSGQVQEHVWAFNAGMVYFYIYQNQGRTICFDTGLRPGFARRQLRRLGIEPRDVSDVFLTHADFDHTGGLAAFPNAQVWLSALEEPMAQGLLPRTFGLLRNRPLRRPYTLLHDGQTVNAGAVMVQAISTPGHTPGSMCYLLEDTLLFIGDAFRLQADRVVPSPKGFNLDGEGAEESIRKLAALSAQWAFTGHSGCTGNYAKAMEQWHFNKKV